MRSLALMVALIFATVAVAPALALGPVHSLTYQSAVEQAKYKAKWKAGGCKYKYSAGPKGYKESMKCK